MKLFESKLRITEAKKDASYKKEVKAYKYFIIDQEKKKAVSGWEFEDDAKDALSDYDGDKNFKVVTEKALDRYGVENPKEKWLAE